MGRFVKVARRSELPENDGTYVEVEGNRIALFNLDGEIYAIDNTCTHVGGPLSMGLVKDDEGARHGRRRGSGGLTNSSPESVGSDPPASERRHTSEPGHRRLRNPSLGARAACKTTSADTIISGIALFEAWSSGEDFPT